ncbi:hypothetical protein MRX96_001363 [Rhipicephalus microplus]
MARIHLFCFSASKNGQKPALQAIRQRPATEVYLKLSQEVGMVGAAPTCAASWLLAVLRYRHSEAHYSGCELKISEGILTQFVLCLQNVKVLPFEIPDLRTMGPKDL